ncbi:hypothetical protein PAXINDRAFT_118692 [Paxillus involutus ATCC 200175]|uniref:T6SS Phospholipase effector Tle1-like catalytic domain-containing protein n=1 Tax=Paxillus involutus ATCC 200175 TaxID=664439 RepID=A0A0C9TWQ8_PAXIN|nr:hypothetical protein PAXINDRAFT_118692 [Paxillus involutus ATCC 200175]
MPSIAPETASGGYVVGSPVERSNSTRCTPCIKCTAPRHSNAEPRNLVVCIDGTSNKFGRKNTNIVKLFAKIDLDPADPALPRQRAYYSSGLGTRPKAWHVVSRIQRSFSDLLDIAVAWNVEEIVQDAYGWLAKEYKEGDQIYLFGFSRGAYQVRILAGMIYHVGLIKIVTDKQIATAYEHHMAVRSRKLHAKDITSAFKRTFCWEDMKVHFVGVWDTVSSVGFVREDVFLSSSSSAEHACHFRHALALDERRVKFIPEYFQEMNTRTDDKKPDNTQNETKTSNIKEVWFAGSHSDSFHAGNVSLMWMRHEAAECGVLLKPTDMVWTPSDLEYGTTNSLSLGWKILEWLPVKHQVSWCGPGELVRK